MPHDASHHLPDLGDFLAALRVHGVPVGPADMDRLRQLFALAPQLDRPNLKNLLSALLVKTPAQRQAFEALFADWCPDHEADWPEEAAPLHAAPVRGALPDTSPPLPPPPQEDSGPPPPPRRVSRVLLAVLLSVCLGALLTWWWWPTRLRIEVIEPPREEPGPPLSLLSTGGTGPDALPAIPVDKVWFWQADVDPQAVRVPWRLGPAELALLGLAAWTLALTSWWQYRRRFPDLKPVARSYRGSNWQPLPPPARHDDALLNARDRRQLVWNIEHFVTDDPTHRLHLAETVDATARAGGYVRLCFEPAVYERQIWFWLDRQLDRPTPQTAVQQLLATLAAAGLEARQGLFTDAPDRVDWPAQPGYRPAHEEGHGRQALVAIFSDGEGLARRLDNPLYHHATDRLLRGFQRWPRLCFVDCSASGAQLAPLLAPYGLHTIALTALPQWLGGIELPAPTPTLPGDGFYGDARVWAAAVALGGAQVETASAHSLRVALGLSVSPWLVDQVLAEAQAAGAWQRLINWLLRCEPRAADGTLQPDSLARRALVWWQQRYTAAAQRMQAQENPLLPWQGSLASQRWQLERALLQLYHDPVGAARHLAQLADAALRDEVHARLAEFAAADHRPPGSGDDSAYIYLTWRFADLPAATRHRLRQAGFAAPLFQHAPPALKDSPRLVLAGTALMMLGMTALGGAAYRWYAPEPPRLLAQQPLDSHPALVAQTVRHREPVGSARYSVTLGSARQLVSLPNVPAGAEIPVIWRWQEGENVVHLEDSESVLLRAGRLAQPIRACPKGWPQRSFVIIAAPFMADDPAARQLAIRLLDKGSADQVLLGTDWPKHLDNWLGPSQSLKRTTQVLVILPDATAADSTATRLASHPGPWAVTSTGDFAGLARAIEFLGSRAVGQVSSLLRVHRVQGQVQVYGGPERKTDASGIEWVKVCPGTFTMGTIEGEDQMAYKDEIVKPPRTVVLSVFQIATTETTKRQYGRVYLAYDKATDEPVVDVTWEQAQGFCQQIDGVLPTEAQWEYAARGGSRFPWSFGDDATLLERYGWFDKNSSEQAHEVKKKLPNPLGLYDMHGNVWEYVRDWYGDYTSGLFVDPLGPSFGRCQLLSGACRAARSGSFPNPYAYLRSTVRVGVLPDGRLRNFGFRCVRVPPQP